MRNKNSTELLNEVQEFQRHEIALLQKGAYEDWLGLFTEDVHYWMPVTYVREGDHTAARDELAHFDDTFETLRLRVRRAKSKVAWTEHPPSRIRYFLQPVAVEPQEDETVHVETNFIVYQTRLQREENYFVGTRYDRLKRTDGGWKIDDRTIVVDRSVLGAKNVTVFF